MSKRKESMRQIQDILDDLDEIDLGIVLVFLRQLTGAERNDA